MKSLVSLWFTVYFFGALSPGVFAGAWTLPKGRLWVKIGLSYQNTSTRFCNGQDALSPAFRSIGCTSAGQRTAFDPFAGGELTAIALFTELAYGVTDRLELGIQIPYYSLQFSNLSNPGRPRTNSLGDLRFYTKYRLMNGLLVGAVTLKAKSPTGQFSIDAEIVNVSENQWDIEASGELGSSLWPIPAYFNLQFGYRYRTDNPRFEHTFGDEIFGSAESGYGLTEQVMIKGRLEWLRGQRPHIRITGAELLWRRELLLLAPSVVLKLRKPFQLEFSLGLPLAGQDFPAGNVLNVTLISQLDILD